MLSRLTAGHMWKVLKGPKRFRRKTTLATNVEPFPHWGLLTIL